MLRILFLHSFDDSGKRNGGDAQVVGNVLIEGRTDKMWGFFEQCHLPFFRGFIYERLDS